MVWINSVVRLWTDVHCPTKYANWLWTWLKKALGLVTFPNNSRCHMDVWAKSSPSKAPSHALFMSKQRLNSILRLDSMQLAPLSRVSSVDPSPKWPLRQWSSQLRITNCAIRTCLRGRSARSSSVKAFVRKKRLPLFPVSIGKYSTTQNRILHSN